MPNVTIKTDRTTSLVRNNPTNSELGISIAEAGSIVVAGDPAIRVTGGTVTVDVSGLVRARGDTSIFLGGRESVDISNAVYVLDSGVVGGGTGIRLDSFGSSVLNRGLISATGTGIQLGGQDTEEISSIQNFGTIEAVRAIRITAGTTEGVAITNYAGATIRATGQGGDAIVSDASRGLGLDIENGGRILGNVRMGGTADTYENTGGRVSGTVFGRGGADAFAPGRTAERIDGGRGFDVLDFGDGPRVRVTLGGAAGSNTGEARGDRYVGVEGVRGSLFGNDDLRGSRAGNALDGQGGRDRLSGNAGADRLTGGAGVDVLTGGRGNDTFVFESAGEGRDRINDFGRVSGNNDGFRLNDAGFGDVDLGALDAAQFVRRGSANTGLDADDRFVFRTSDRTLWFDTDGAGGSGPVLIADLQSGADVTASDIVIF